MTDQAESSTRSRTGHPHRVGAPIDALVDLLFPWSCFVCQSEARGLCIDCRTELLESGRSACPRCALLVRPSADLSGGCSECRDRLLGFDAALALGPYTGPIREACLKLKRSRSLWLAPILAELVVAAHGERLQRQADAVVVPVPLHWTRRWRRGFNQAEALARRIAVLTGLGFHQPLHRPLATPPLARLSRAERSRVLRHAFEVRRPEPIQGRTVLLVDDIMTTGATCGSAARALKQAGASRVVALVVARAGDSLR